MSTLYTTALNSLTELDSLPLCMSFKSCHIRPSGYLAAEIHVLCFGLQPCQLLSYLKLQQKLLLLFISGYIVWSLK